MKDLGGAIIVGSHEGVGSDGMKSGGIQWVVQERQAASCDLHGGTKSGLDTTVENIKEFGASMI